MASSNEAQKRSEPVGQGIFPFSAIESRAVLDSLNFLVNPEADQLLTEESDIVEAQSIEVKLAMGEMLTFYRNSNDPDQNTITSALFLMGNLAVYRLVRQKLEAQGKRMPRFSPDHVLEAVDRFHPLIEKWSSPEDRFKGGQKDKEVLEFESSEPYLSGVAAQALGIGGEGIYRESFPAYAGMVFQYHLLKDGLTKSGATRNRRSPIPWLTTEQFEKEAQFDSVLSIIARFDRFFYEGYHARYPSVSIGRKLEPVDPDTDPETLQRRSVVGLYIDGYEGVNANVSLVHYPILDNQSADFLLSLDPQHILPEKRRKRDINSDQRLTSRISTGELPVALAVIERALGNDAVLLFHSPAIRARDAIEFIHTGVEHFKQGEVEVLRSGNQRIH